MYILLQDFIVQNYDVPVVVCFFKQKKKKKKNNNVSIRYAYEIVYSHRSIFIDILHRLVIIKSQPNS